MDSMRRKRKRRGTKKQSPRKRGPISKEDRLSPDEEEVDEPLSEDVVRDHISLDVRAVNSDDISLLMECWSEPLSESQKRAQADTEREFDDAIRRLADTIRLRNGKLIEEGKYVTVYEIDRTPDFPPPPPVYIQQEIPATPTGIITASKTPVISPQQQPLLMPGQNPPSGVFSPQTGTYQLVVGPRMGLIVTPSTPGTVTTLPGVNTTSAISQRPTIMPKVHMRPTVSTVSTPPAKRAANAGTATPKISINPATQKPTLSPVMTPKTGPKTASPATQTPPAQPVVPTVSTRLKNRATSGAAKVQEVTASAAVTSVPTPPKTTAVVDLTDDDNSKPTSDSKEMSFNRYPGRIYPSLVVVARPSIKIKDMTSAMITTVRSQLDTKVKSILTHSPTKFTEWLIQQGLVRSEQLCSIHTNPDKTPVKLKLGMYSDVSKFPYSGGYVWISDCCPQKFVSVFCNSIFEGAPHPPTVLLKLMYHWACQTNVHNIISWVKVDNLYIKNFFTNLRAICTAAIWKNFEKMGGPQKKVEVGVISLGTTSQNGQIRQVKVEVLGIMDPITKHIRLRAIEPTLNAEKNHKLRFSRILEPLDKWVHKSTTIVTDFTVDKATLQDLGFRSVVQVQLNSTGTKDNNQAIMEYLKRVVPRMFQNTLSLLSRPIIQQFLDELVWRERWGSISSCAFECMVTHLAELTKAESDEPLISRLKAISSNPFKDWSSYYSSSTDTGKNETALERDDTVVRITIDDDIEDVTITPSIQNYELEEDSSSSKSSGSSKKGRTRQTEVKSSAQQSVQPVLKSLESHYYGSLPGDKFVLSKLRRSVELNMKCYVCGIIINNNILFMKHLAGHAQNESVFNTDFQCKYCFKHFTTAEDLEEHHGNTHFSSKFSATCLICERKFRYRGGLIVHMLNVHLELEMPYQCSICKFRSSEHTKLVDHFYEIHVGGEKVQCPFCLKIVSFESNNKVKLTQNIGFFYNHIKKHQLKQNKPCSKCALSFVNRNFLKDHLSKDHVSCAYIPGVCRYQVEMLNSIALMPVIPVTGQNKKMSVKIELSPIPGYSVYKLHEVISYPPHRENVYCVECGDSTTPPQHFPTFMSCMKCMYATCCKKAMNQHIERFHELRGKRRNLPRKKIPLESPLYCVCGFSSVCGNDMATHLASCKRKIAYPSKEKAKLFAVKMQSANFPSLVNLTEDEQPSEEEDDEDQHVDIIDPDKASDEWLRSFVKSVANESQQSKSKTPSINKVGKSPPAMLKMLGLVCTEPPATDTLNSSVIETSNITDSSNKEDTSKIGIDERPAALSNQDVNEADSKLVAASKEKLADLPKTTQEGLEKYSSDSKSGNEIVEDTSVTDGTECTDDNHSQAESDNRKNVLQSSEFENNENVNVQLENSIVSGETCMDFGSIQESNDLNLIRKDAVIENDNEDDDFIPDHASNTTCTSVPDELSMKDSSNEVQSENTSENELNVISGEEKLVNTEDETAPAKLTFDEDEREKQINEVEGIERHEENIEVEVSDNNKESAELRDIEKLDYESSDNYKRNESLHTSVFSTEKSNFERCDKISNATNDLDVTMDTEEQSPQNVEMDDSTAMECEDNEDGINMAIDQDSTLDDSMIID